MEAGSSDSSQSQTRKAQIQMVPDMLMRKNAFEKCFIPTVVSIGPRYELGEDLKKELARDFIMDCGCPVEELYNDLFKEIKELRAIYEEGITRSTGFGDQWDDFDLTHTLLVDGCFVLYFIHCFVSGKFKDLKMNNYHFACVLQDLFLLENQLPFRVLGLLMSSRFKRNEGMEMIEKFIAMNIKTPQSKRRKQWQPQLHQELQIKKEKPSHLLELLRTRLIGKSSTKTYNEEEGWHPFCNATELNAVGIHLKPSETSCLTDISFNPHWIIGHLKLPPIIIDDSMKRKFLNLIAYEMCPNVPNDFEVTSYISFLYSLMSHSDDVKMLREAGIIHNFLGSDEEVAKLFKEIATNAVPGADAYRDVKGQIRHYLDQRGKTKVAFWVAEVIRDYFKSPWTIIAVLAGFIAISVSVVQT